MINILLVEDDDNLGYILKEYLEMNDYHIILARDGEEGLRLFNENKVDLCILDIMLPKKDGFSLAMDIRKQNKQIPVIFLTAKALKIDKLKGFKIGADDYLVKPVDEEELIARIEAIIRRTQPKDGTESIENFTIGFYQFNYENLSLSYSSKKINLTQKEADLLKLLCENKDKILDRQYALKLLWGKNDYFNRRSMDVFISRLRKYLSEDNKISIKNIHGKGFILKVSE